MTSNHTPGPWRVADRSSNDGEAFVIEAEDKTICWTADTCDEGVTEEDRANAELIALAPEMFEALQAILARLQGEWDHPALVKQGPLSVTAGQDISRFATEIIERMQK